MLLKSQKTRWKIPLKEFMFLESCRIKKWTLWQVFFNNFLEIVCCLLFFFLKFSNSYFQLHSFFFVLVLSFFRLQIYFKKPLSQSHLQTFVDQEPKQPFSCDFPENFKIAIVIKIHICVCAWYNFSRHYSSKKVKLNILTERLIFIHIEPLFPLGLMFLRV